MTSENKQRLDGYISAVNERIGAYKIKYGTDGYQQRVIEAMWYSLSAGGKRIRPVLVMEFSRICGGDTNEALTAAAAVEMLHTFSLIHDDLPCMDNDDYRRGRPSCHKAYGEDTALLAGDALENLAFGVIADDELLSAEKKVRLISELSRAAGTDGMIGGQVIDMDNVNGAVFPDEKLLAMYRMKTAALLSAACRMGCICAGAYDMLDAASEYAENLGLAFQITDDILDITSTSEILGKPVGSDKEMGRCTYAAVHGIADSEKYAAELSRKAENALIRFNDTGFLAELTELLLYRKK